MRARNPQIFSGLISVMRLLITYIAYFTLISRSVLLYLVLITHEAFEGRGESSSLTLLDWCNYVTMYKEQPCTYSLVVDGCCTRFVDVESGILIINFRGEIETLVGFDVRSCTWILGGSFKANGWMVERLYGGVWCFFFLFFFCFIFAVYFRSWESISILAYPFRLSIVAFDDIALLFHF